VDLYSASTPRQPRRDSPMTLDQVTSGQGFTGTAGFSLQQPATC